GLRRNRMPDKQPNQRPLFEDSIPPMPEGYYSSGLNPHLRDFVEKYSKLYVPEADEYNVPAFNQQITIEKRKSASMDLHIYWSKKHHEAIAQYVQHYTEPGDILLDPFCGSGGTALAALVQGRAAIAIDLSPAA